MTLVRYLPGLGISEIRDLLFRGPIWISLRNSGSFCVGQVPRTSHVATRPKKDTCERLICPSLSRPFAAGPASSLFVVVQSVLDVIRIPGTRYGSSFSSFFSLFFFFGGWFFQKEYQVLTQIILFAAACCIYTINFSFFFAFLSVPKCMHPGRMVIALYQRSGLLPKRKWLYSCMHTYSEVHRFKTGPGR